MKVKIEKLNENAKVPVKSKEGDFCYDVWAVSEEEIAPNIWRYGLGFCYELVRGKEQLEFYNKNWCKPGITINLNNSPISIDIDFRPRSSVWKTGMSLANCEGTLDEFYRGEAMAIFYHVMPNMPRYKVGDRIGQIKLGISFPMEFEVVDSVNKDTERGDGGFGSTGNK